MGLTLTNTNAAKISAALLKARRSAGSPAMGMVLTLIIVCDESEYEAAMKASMEAGREHPSRILLVVSGQGRTAMLDAEVRIGEGTPGEVVIIRMRGAIAAHPASVIRPLLLPDSPVVVWWPDESRGGRARSPCAAPAHRLVDRGAATGGFADTSRELHARRHRSELDQTDPVASAPRRRPRPVPVEDHLSAGGGRAKQSVRRPARRLAAQPAEPRGRPASEPRPGNHRRPPRYRGR